MTATGRIPAWRRRLLMGALVMMGAAIFLPLNWRGADASETTELTVLFHGSVLGKIAPCG